MYLPRSLLSLLYTHLIKTHQPLSAPVLILPNLDTDAICACRILTALLKRDYIPHKIQPVAGYNDLSKAGETLVGPMKTSQGGSGGVVICLGVGGAADLATILDIEEDDSVEVWLLDSRRPWNLENVFGGWCSKMVDDDSHVATRKIPGVDKGCIQRSYKPGKGGVIVFDDGDIVEEMDAERNAYCAILEMPDIDYESGDDQDADDLSAVEEANGEDEDALSNVNEESTHESPRSRKRKSLSDHDQEGFDDEDEDDGDSRPQQRRRSNSGSSIRTPRTRSTPPSSRGASPIPAAEAEQDPDQMAKLMRRKLLSIRKSHDRICAEYRNLGSSFSEPLSSLLYSLASELGREDNDLLWLAIVGVTSLELSGRTSTGLGTPHTKAVNFSSRMYHQGWREFRSSRTYALLRDEVRRLNPPPNEKTTLFGFKTNNVLASDSSIQLVPDPRFILLRHWSLYDSMLHSPYLAARLHVWNDAGVKRLHKLLAKMGISLNQCKQGYVHMDAGVRTDLRERLLKYASLYGLDELVPAGNGSNQEGWGFLRNWGWKAQLSAVDVGIIVDAILEMTTAQSDVSKTSTTTTQESSTQSSDANPVEDRSTSLLPKFFAAYDALAPNNPAKLLASLSKAQDLMKSIHRTGASLLAKKQVKNLSGFGLGIIKDGPDLDLFANSPGALIKLALWLAEVIAINEKDKRGSNRNDPFILSALDESRGCYLVVGIGGGIGGVEDQKQREKNAEEKKRREKEREEKREKRDAERRQRRLMRELADVDDDDEESEEEEIVTDDDDDDMDEELRTHLQKRGFGRNRFAIAFREVIEETSTTVTTDSFEHCVIEVEKSQLQDFLQALSRKVLVGR